MPYAERVLNNYVFYLQVVGVLFVITIMEELP